MKLPDHLMCSDFDGSLYDTRLPGWSASSPLRAVYRRTFSRIRNAAQLKATLRAGRFTGYGRYPLYFVMADGESMSFASVSQNLRECIDAFGSNGSRDWRVVGCEINYEDSDLHCAHSGESIESAYAEDQKESRS